MEITFPLRSLDCVRYSQCLIQAVRQCLPAEGFSCAGCKGYEQEQIDDAERVREGIRAQKLIKAVWKDEKRTVRHRAAFSFPLLY